MSLAAVWEHIPFFPFWWLCADLLISIILCFQMWVKARGDKTPPSAQMHIHMDLQGSWLLSCLQTNPRLHWRQSAIHIL